MNGVNLVLLFFLAFTALDCSFRRITAYAIDLTGGWTNELNSTVDIEQEDDGTIRGIYTSAVSSEGKSITGPLRGMVGSVYPTSLGFVVMWNDGKSSTSWSGQYQFEDGEEKLLTTWLLTSAQENPADNWKSTRIGKDTFKKTVVSSKKPKEAVSEEL